MRQQIKYLKGEFWHQHYEGTRLNLRERFILIHRMQCECFAQLLFNSYLFEIILLKFLLSVYFTSKFIRLFLLYFSAILSNLRI